MKISVIHPFRHHAYHSSLGIAKTDNEFKSIFGMYNTGSNLFKMIEKTKYNNKVKGYSNNDLNEFVLSKDRLSLLFLLSKINPKMYNAYIKQFEKFVIKNIVEDDVVYLLQDYCQGVFDCAYESGKYIIYDHIMPCGLENRKILLEEAKRWGYSSDYVEQYMPEKKIYVNYDNINKANLVINASNSTKEVCLDALNNNNTDKLRVIPYGNKLSQNNIILPRDKYKNISSRKLKILYVGSISLIKGTEYLLEALNGIDTSEIELGIVGVPNKPEDIKIVEKIKERDYIKYYGSVPHINIGEIYKSYDIFVLPSIIEGFGMVTLEALSYGLPCIVNEKCRGVIENGVDGFVIESRNIKQLQEKILDLMNNKDKVIRMSENAIIKSKKYTWDRYELEISKLINSIRI